MSMKLPCLTFCIIQIRDRIDGMVYFVDKGIEKEAKWKASPATHWLVTADEFIDLMVWIHEKNYSLVKCCEYDTMLDAVHKWKSDFYKT